MAANPKLTQSAKRSRTAPRPVAIHPATAGINNEAERVLLSDMVLAYEALEAASDVLTPDDFYEPRHRAIFEAMGDCGRLDDGTIDVVMLDEALKRAGSLGAVTQAYVHQLVDFHSNAYDFAQHIKIVLECSLERQKQTVGAQLAQGSIMPAECIMRLQAIEVRRERVLSGTVRTLGIVASSVQPEPIRWLWKRRLARGKLAIVDGDPGLGKGFLTIDLAARKSTGRPFPDEKERQDAGAVILITPEDDIADTLVPRLVAAQADLSRVHILNTITELDPETGREIERSVTIPRDIPQIEALATQTGAELLIIDPIMGCLDAGVKTAIDNEVRSALMPLKHLATRAGLAVLLVRHLNKSASEKALYRGGGSIAFSALCRTAFIVAEHPDNSAKRVFLSNKNNISKEAPGLIFSLSALDDDATPWVSWELDESELHANDVLSNGAKRSAEAREMLDVMKSGTVQLPAKPSAIAAAMEDGGADEKAVMRISKRLSRMAKSGLICSPAYGLYDLPHAKHH